MPRAGVTPQRIVSEAADLADERGVDQITLAALAERLGVRVPSLYKHITSLEDVQTRLAEQSRLELTGVIEQAAIGRSGASAIRSVANALRTWALIHPGRYSATVRATHAGQPTPTDRRALAVFLQILANGEVASNSEADLIHRARALRSTIHGFVDLELRGGFGLPTDIEVSWDYVIDLLARRLEAPSSP